MTTDSASSLSEIWQTARGLPKATYQRFLKLHMWAKITIFAIVLFDIATLIAILIITPDRIFQFLYDQASKLAESQYGWLVLGLALVLVSFPPLIGHTTILLLCGFAYGMLGFAIASIGSLLGSVVVFVTLRYFFGTRLRNWSEGNSKWQALEEVIETKGLGLIILIRVSPFPPWVYSNTLFASISSVKLWQFAFATLFTFPKILLDVFIGSRLAALADGEQRSHMDKQTKIINGLSIGGGILLTLITSVVVYRSVQNHIRHLGDLPDDVDNLAADAIEDAVDEDAPLLRMLSSDSRRTTSLDSTNNGAIHI